MTKSGITWRGESIDDVELLRELPPSLVRMLSDTNGLIVHQGALHVRGASLAPEWHSLRAAWRGPNAFHTLYEEVQVADIPFAQDQVGDQFLLRDGVIFRLDAEAGKVEQFADSLDNFLHKIEEDTEGFLNVGLGHTMQPGELLLAIHPFVLRESGTNASLRPAPATQVILFHADLARQIRDVPDGGRVEIKITG